MISSDTVADRLFKILKGNGFSLELYTSEGDTTVNPGEARRFYVPDEYIMVNLDETESKREIRISLSAGTNMDDIKSVLEQIKNLANRSVIEYTLKQYSKQITSKDFEYQAKRDRDMKKMDEAISHAYGSKKSSYQTLESAKLIIKHSSAVNEESRGSRSRNIKAIFIENSDGERYKFPSNNLAGGRAMLRHVKEGGVPYDSFGKHIIEKCNELKKLKEFRRYTQRNNLVNEDTSEILEAVAGRIANIRESLKKWQGVKNYSKAIEDFNEEDLVEGDYSDIKDKFTVSYFDETVEDALPYVHSLVQEMQTLAEKDEYADKTFDELYNAIKNTSHIDLLPEVDLASDPENPFNNDVLTGAPVQAQIGAIVEYMSSIMGDNESELSLLLSRVSDMVNNLEDEDKLNNLVHALISLVPKMKPGEAQSPRQEDIATESTLRLKKALSGYNVGRIFS